MASAADDVQTYLLSITIVPQQGGVNVRRLIHGIKSAFDIAADVRILHLFKVSGEGKIISVVEVSNATALENLTESFWNLGSTEIVSSPIVHYSTFARSIGVAEQLAALPEATLGKDNLYWVDVNIEYNGKTLKDFLALWKTEAEFVLTAVARGEANLIPFKTVGQRQITLFLNHPSAGQLDTLITSQLPIVIGDGDNMQFRAKRLEFLEEYTKAHPLTK